MHRPWAWKGQIKHVPQLYEKTCCLPLNKKSLDLKRSESGSTGAVGSLQGLLGWTSHTPQCDFRGAHHDWKTLNVAREKLTLTDSGRKLYLGGASFEQSQLKISAAWRCFLMCYVINTTPDTCISMIINTCASWCPKLQQPRKQLVFGQLFPMWTKVGNADALEECRHGCWRSWIMKRIHS